MKGKEDKSVFHSDRTGISCIVPTRNRRNSFQKLLASLLPQLKEYDELIIVDDHSSNSYIRDIFLEVVSRNNWKCTLLEKSMKYMAMYLETYPGYIAVPQNREEELCHHEQYLCNGIQISLYIFSKQRGVAVARNLGAMYATLPFCLFLDDDVTVLSGLLAAYRKELETGHPDLLWGQVLSPGNNMFPQKVVANSHSGFPMGANLLCQRNTFLRIGGFDALFGAMHNEDTEFVCRALVLGIQGYYLQSAIVIHEEQYWTYAMLWKSRLNMAIIPIIRKRYPLVCRLLPGLSGGIYRKTDLLILLTLPMSLPLICIRFVIRRRRLSGLGLVVWKWLMVMPCARIHMWKMAIHEKVFVL